MKLTYFYLVRFTNAAYNMSYSKSWLRFRKSEDDYFTCRYDFMRDEKIMVDDLRAALLSASDRETALRLLAEMKPSVVVIAPLIPMVAESAIDSSGLTVIGLAREILYNYKGNAQVKETIQAVAVGYLARDDEWHCRRLAELYELLDYTAEFDSLVALCQTNINPEIRDISEDFKSVSAPIVKPITIGTHRCRRR